MVKATPSVPRLRTQRWMKRRDASEPPCIGIRLHEGLSLRSACRLWGWPREGGGDMAGNEPDTAEDIDDDEDDWMKYANAGFGETDYSLWDDVEPVEEDEAHQQEVAMQLGTHVEEIILKD